MLLLLHQLRKALRQLRSCSVWKSKGATVQEKPPLKNGAPPVRGGRTPEAKTVTALIICCTKGFVSIFVEAKLYSKAKPSEYAAIFTREPLTRVPTASSKQGKRLGGVAGSMQPSTETSESFGGFDAFYAFLYQFLMEMRRMATARGCITTVPPQKSRPGASPRPAVADPGSTSPQR